MFIYLYVIIETRIYPNEHYMYLQYHNTTHISKTLKGASIKLVPVLIKRGSLSLCIIGLGQRQKNSVMFLSESEYKGTRDTYIK